MPAIVCDRWDMEGGGCERYRVDLVSHTTLAGMEPVCTHPISVDERLQDRFGGSLTFVGPVF